MRTVDDFKINSGCLGNGTTFWNSKKETRGDFESIAHVSTDGLQISWYVNDLPESLQSEIRAYAKDQIKPAELIDETKLPDGFELTTGRFQGYAYVKCDPRFQGGKQLWLRKEKVEPFNSPQQISETFPKPQSKAKLRH
jgi:hypothetical protein